MVGQQHSKKVLSVAVYNHYKRLNANQNQNLTAAASVGSGSGGGGSATPTSTPSLVPFPFAADSSGSISYQSQSGFFWGGGGGHFYMNLIGRLYYLNVHVLLGILVCHTENGQWPPVIFGSVCVQRWK